MSREYKYVVGDIRQEFIEVTVAVCFDHAVAHSTMKPLFTQIHGAGFFYVDDVIVVHVYGDSKSLDIKSRLADVAFIEKAVGLSKPIY